jgi:hypothetical protein
MPSTYDESNMSTPHHARDFAPLSEGPSARLRVVAGYFTLSALLTFALVLLALVAVLSGRPPAVREQARAHPIVPVINLTVAALLFAVGALLRRRARVGGMLALLGFAPPLIARLLGRPVSTITLALSAIGIVLVASIWSELDAGKRVLD